MLGEQTIEEAVFWYGVYSNSMGLGFLLLWVLLNGESWVAWYKDGFLSRITFYLAAGVAWLMVLFFDGEFMRSIYLDIQALSVMGPFFFHWYGFAMYLMSILDLDGGVLDWIMLAVWFSLTVFEQILQIILLPKVFDWAYTAPIIDNSDKSEDVEENEAEAEVTTEEESDPLEDEEDFADEEEAAAEEEAATEE